MGQTELEERHRLKTLLRRLAYTLIRTRELHNNLVLLGQGLNHGLIRTHCVHTFTDNRDNA